MSLFDTFDRTGEVEFPFARPVVFRAVQLAVPKLKGMTIAESNPVAGHLFIKTGVSAFSWGEKVQVSIVDAGPGRCRMQIASAGKTIAGSATTHGKNRKNVQDIISGTSRELEQHGENWTLELAPATSAWAAPTSAPDSEKASVETRLIQLADLHSKGLISDEEYGSRRASILDEV